MTNIPEAMRHLIVEKIMQGESQRKVAVQLNVSLATVNRIWVRYRHTGSIENQPRSGRPRKTSERERRHFCQLAMKKSFSSPRQLLSEAKFENDISLRSARRILHEKGLFGRIA